MIAIRAKKSGHSQHGPTYRSPGSQLFSDYAAASHCFDGTDACVPSITEGLAMANTEGETVSSPGVLGPQQVRKIMAQRT